MLKQLMGTLSPVYGMATGEGLFGNAVGAVPAIAQKLRKDEEEKEQDAKKGSAGPKMKKGGSVSSASKRADGCAKRGKTRGMMV